jgi:DNA-binding transcriptional regulator YiaG
MKTAECSVCGAAVTVTRGQYRFKECGLPNVVLSGVELIHCEDCGNTDPIIPRISDLMRTLATALVAKPCKLDGREVRFLRKYLRMNGEEFSSLLKINKSTLSKWENNEQEIGPQSDLLIRGFAAVLGDGLRKGIEETFRNFQHIQDGKSKTRLSLDAESMQYAYA